ncbi:MAG: hypothetical protein GEV08_16170 [Acidimicrobiia bacterium]|nr:hypothetical protein [Acidimicrobiia bacterium]
MRAPAVGSALVRYLSLAVLTVLLVVSAAGFFITRHAFEAQEGRLLEQRAGEVAALLTRSVDSIATALRLLAEAYRARQGEGPAFTAAAESVIEGNVAGVGVAEADGPFVVRAAVGDAPQNGSALEGDRAALARRALQAEDMVSELVEGGGTSGPKLVFALGPHEPTVIYQETAIDPSRAIPRAPGSPFANLSIALYRSAGPTPSELVLTTTPGHTFSGLADRRALAVGDEQWLLVTAAARPLGGTLARIVPWIVLGIGTAAAFGAAVVVEIVVRRREYAMALVEERTASLRETVGQLEAARAVADEANRSKSEFLSRMSHELRTPMNAVLGFAQLLELDDLDTEQREAVKQILKGGNHLLELINEVLDIARIEAGRLDLSPEPVLLSDVLADTLDLVGPMAAQHSVHLVGDRRGTCAEYVFADRQRLKQILLNLLANGVKYNRPGGMVALTCGPSPPGRLRLDVSDTGPGIPAEQVGLLFVPFERLGASQSTVEGTGIGLALSRRLAEAMHGTLGVRSVEGEGSTFWLELPLVEGPVERYDRLNHGRASEGTPSRRARRHAVLYVEDNLANLKLVQRILDQRDESRSSPPCKAASASGWPASTGPPWSSSTSTCPTSVVRRSSSGCGRTRQRPPSPW